METQTLIITVLLIVATLAFATHAQTPVQTAGGNITSFSNLGTTGGTTRWEGFVGRIDIGGTEPTVNATGGNISTINVNATASCGAPILITGQILFSNSTTPPTGLVAGNLSLLDAFVGGAIDSGSNTFTLNSTFIISGNPIFDVPTTNTYVNNNPQQAVFREGYLNDALGNLIFAVDIDFNTQGYNSSIFDYQAILPTQNASSIQYFTTALLDITCPVAPSGGGGGGGGGRAAYCLGNWTCGPWSGCAYGTQIRSCSYDSTCKPRAQPSSIRVCNATAPIQAPFFPISEREVIKELHERKPIQIIAPDLTTTLSERGTYNVTLINPNDESEELITVDLITPTIRQSFVPFHTRPRFYTLTRTLPLGIVNQEIAISTLPSPPIRIPPHSNTSVGIPYSTPIFKPQTLQARVNARTRDVVRASQPISIKALSTPYALMTQRDDRSTDVIIFIDNSATSSRDIPLELDFNRKRSSVFTDSYTLTVPANGYGLYGQRYRTPYPYDTVHADVNGLIAEVR